jgi:hypothetical protein
MKYQCGNAVVFALLMAELTHQLYDKYHENPTFTGVFLFGQIGHCL